MLKILIYLQDFKLADKIIILDDDEWDDSWYIDPDGYAHSFPPYLPADHWFYQTRQCLEQRLAHRQARLKRLIALTEFKVGDDSMPHSGIEEILHETNKTIKTGMIANVEAGLLKFTIEKEYELIDKAEQELEEWDRTHG